MGFHLLGSVEMRLPCSAAGIRDRPWLRAVSEPVFETFVLTEEIRASSCHEGHDSRPRISAACGRRVAHARVEHLAQVH
jgi:hypothetical protein